jgi:hypothetical protein
MTLSLARIMIRLGLNLNWLAPVEAFRCGEPVLRRHLTRS